MIQKYIEERKAKDLEFAEGFDSGYQNFKIGVLLKMARKEACLTQKQLAERVKTKKTAISRIENHADDIKLSTLKKIASALNKELRVQII